MFSTPNNTSKYSPTQGASCEGPGNLGAQGFRGPFVFRRPISSAGVLCVRPCSAASPGAGRSGRKRPCILWGERPGSGGKDKNRLRHGDWAAWSSQTPAWGLCAAAGNKNRRACAPCYGASFFLFDAIYLI